MNNPYLAPGPAGYGAPAAPGAPAPFRSNDAEVSGAAVEAVRQTKPWVTLLGVLGFILSGLFLAGALLMIVFGLFSAVGGAGASAAMSGLAVGAVYVPLALVYLYPALKLWKYSRAIGRLVTSYASSDLEDALREQKSFWKFVGVTSIVGIALYAVIFVVLISVVVAKGAHG